MALPQAFLGHLRQKGYHPRSDKHSNALGEAIVADLMANCPAMAERAAAGSLVYYLNFTVWVQASKWKTDLVLGTPPPGTNPPTDGRIQRMKPSTVQVAVEFKSTMTEHRKAIFNRKRDLEAHRDHANNYSTDTIAGAGLLVNASPTFQSPLRPETTEHKRPHSLVRRCVDVMRTVPIRGGPDERGLDANTVLVVSMDNINLETTAFVDRQPAPTVGDPLHYDSFIQRICNDYRTRFTGSGGQGTGLWG